MRTRPNVTTLAILGLLLLLLDLATVAQTVDQPKKNEPLAIVGGQPIYDDDLLPYVQGQLFQFRLQEYEVKSKALENLVNQKLLEAEARKKGIPTENVFAQEVDAKVSERTAAGLHAVDRVPIEQMKNTCAVRKEQPQQYCRC